MAKPGDVIFWTDDTQAGADEARAYCRAHGLTSDVVRIVRRHAPTLKRIMVMVEVKKTCKLKIGS